MGLSSRGFPSIEAMEGRQFFSAAPAGPIIGLPTGQGVKLTAYEDVSYHGVVGSFKASLATLDNFSIRVNINWGDGAKTGGRIVPNAKGGYDVIGTHTFAENGKFNVKTEVSAWPVVTPGQPSAQYFIPLADIKSSADVKDLKSVALHAPSWIPDLTYDISVSSTGVLTFSAPTIKTRPVQLTEVQEDALRSAFAGWEKLKRSYPNPPGTADANDVTIGYGGKLVTVGDAVLNAPAAFRAVQSLLLTYSGLATAR